MTFSHQTLFKFACSNILCALSTLMCNFFFQLSHFIWHWKLPCNSICFKQKRLKALDTYIYFHCHFQSLQWLPCLAFNYRSIILETRKCFTLLFNKINHCFPIVKVIKYLAPPHDGVCIRPHIFEWTNSKRSLVLVITFVRIFWQFCLLWKQTWHTSNFKKLFMFSPLTIFWFCRTFKQSIS
jgi:hypothetical protein